MIYLLGFSQAIFFIAFLMFQRRSQANALLIAWLALIALSLGHSYLINTGLIYDYLFLLGIDGAVPYSCGPFLYFYVLLLTGRIKQLRWRHVVHLIPFMVNFILLSFLLYFKDESYKQALLDQTVVAIPRHFVLYNLGLKILHALVYALVAYRLILKHRKQVKHVQGAVWNWLQALYAGLMLVNFMMFMAWLNLVSPNEFLRLFSLPALTLTLFGIVYMIVFFALRHPEIFRKQEIKYDQSGLSKKQSEQLWQDLVSFVTVNKSFEQNDLTIAKLASQFGISSKALSQIINENSGSNFTHFINELRVQAVKDRFDQQMHKNLTLEAIALECGFSSRSSFFAVFKKVENCTPGQYLEDLSSISTR